MMSFILVVDEFEILQRYEYAPFTRVIKPLHGIKVSDFKIMPIALNHSNNDGSRCECLGFVIDHPESGRILFVTDTMTLDMIVPRMTHIMI